MIKINPNNGTRMAISYPIKVEKTSEELHKLAVEVEKMESEGYVPVKVTFTENWDTHDFKLVVVVEDKRFFITDEHTFSSQL